MTRKDTNLTSVYLGSYCLLNSSLVRHGGTSISREKSMWAFMVPHVVFS